MIGKTVEHYRITERLGAGGMGEVYRARDTRLERDVAIKVLPDGFTRDSGRRARFEREARLLAALNHPIAAVYELTEVGGVHYLVMEYVPGRALRVPLRTVAYMSPEQARGLPLDRRTDIWAFGR